MSNGLSQSKILQYDRKRIEKILEVNSITPTKSVEECLNEYFNLIKAEIAKYSPTLSQDKTKSLYYSKMKRFIFTAYNNLFEMDSKFFDDNLRQLRRDLFGLEKVDEHVRGILLGIQNTYDNIFLKKQKDYILVEKYLALSQARLSALSTNERALKALMFEKEKKMNEHSKLSLKYKEAEDELKKVRRQYADLTHELYAIKNETQTLAHLKIEFEKNSYEIFLEILKEKVKILENGLLNILNHKAYTLDFDLWSKAKKSENIRQFFKVAKIDGGFSSKTYLKYFLKNLDETKSSEIQDELREILKYLEKITQKDILLIVKSEEEIEHYKYLIELADKDYVVKGFHRAFSALTNAHQKDFDLILIDYELNDMSAVEFLKDFKYELPHKVKKTKFAILVDSTTKDIVLKFAKLGVKPYFISKTLNDEEFEEKVLSIFRE